MLIERENGQCDADQRNDGGIAQQGGEEIQIKAFCHGHNVGKHEDGHTAVQEGERDAV